MDKNNYSNVKYVLMKDMVFLKICPMVWAGRPKKSLIYIRYRYASVDPMEGFNFNV
jgi:hypothetical protein